MHNRHDSRLILTTCLIAVVLLRTYYTAEITSMVAEPNPKFAFKSIEEVAKQITNGVKVLVAKGSTSEEYFMVSRLLLVLLHRKCFTSLAHSLQSLVSCMFDNRLHQILRSKRLATFSDNIRNTCFTTRRTWKTCTKWSTQKPYWFRYISLIFKRMLFYGYSLTHW